PSRSPDHIRSAPPAPPPAPRRVSVSVSAALALLGNRVVLAPRFGRCSAPAPGRDLSVDVTRRGEYRWALAQVHRRRTHTFVESGQVVADVGLTVEDVERVLEDSVLLAQLEGGRGDPADVLLIQLLLDPPVGVLGIAQTFQRSAQSRQIIEVAALDRPVDGGFDDSVAVFERIQSPRPLLVLRVFVHRLAPKQSRCDHFRPSDGPRPCERPRDRETITGSFRSAWQMKDSNLRRQCRLIYSQLPLAARAICRSQC